MYAIFIAHCYWWLNRKNNNNELSASQWRKIIRNTFKKQHIFVVTLVGCEPTLRPDIIQVFCEEMPKRVCVVTNGTYPLKRFEDLYFYWISMDGTEKVHDSIRVEGSYSKTKQNILDYIAGANRHNKPAWKDIWITMTINSLNYDSVKGDPLWMPFGGQRNNIVERLITLKKKYPNFVVNGIKQLSLMKVIGVALVLLQYNVPLGLYFH
jgi:Fe-coproporphyrin III synthase